MISGDGSAGRGVVLQIDAAAYLGNLSGSQSRSRAHIAKRGGQVHDGNPILSQHIHSSLLLRPDIYS